MVAGQRGEVVQQAGEAGGGQVLGGGLGRCLGVGGLEFSVLQRKAISPSDFADLDALRSGSLTSRNASTPPPSHSTGPSPATTFTPSWPASTPMNQLQHHTLRDPDELTAETTRPTARVHTALVPTRRQRLLKLVREPGRVPGAVLRRALPRSQRFGFPWVELPDGSVTFHERGFVAATSPAMLLARHNYETRRIASALSGIRASRSLEVGCGFGRLSLTIAEHSDAHTAIDINRDALDLAQASYPRIDFQYGSAESLPFLDATFDLLVTWTVLQHVRPERIDRACSELVRVLASGATVLLCEETARPHDSGGHTWHRTVQDYERLLSPLTLVTHGTIVEIESIPGMESPGEIMVFRG